MTFRIFLCILKVGKVIFDVAELIFSVLAVFVEEGNAILHSIELMPEGYSIFLIESTDHVIPFFDSSHDQVIIIKDCLYIMKCPIRAGCASGQAVCNNMGYGAIIYLRPK